MLAACCCENLGPTMRFSSCVSIKPFPVFWVFLLYRGTRFCLGDQATPHLAEGQTLSLSYESDKSKD